MKAGRLAYALAWGDSAARSRTWATVDTLDAEFLQLTGMFLNNGRFLPISEALRRQPQARVNMARWCRTCLSMILLWEGKFQEEIRLLDHPLMLRPVRRLFAYDLHFFGMPLPESLERDLAFQTVETDTLVDVPLAAISWFFAGAYAADRGRWPEHATAVQAFRIAARQAGRDSAARRTRWRDMDSGNEGELRSRCLS